MMKSYLKQVVIYMVTLYVLSQILTGFKITGGIITYILAGIIFTIINLLIKPILQIITLPLNILTLGLFSIITNAFILYIATIFIPNLTIFPFTFKGYEIAGFVIPKIYFNALSAFLISSIMFSAIIAFLKWFCSD